ncbi:MAG: S-adenosylmethionine decarboxylase [Candidatus Peribacteraceae bacterium]
MRNLAPQVVRQRLLIEGLFDCPVDEARIAGYFETLTRALGLKMYASPMIYSLAGMGRTQNQGYDAFVPLIDSGISAYFWNEARLLSVLIYSCRAFDAEKAAAVAREYFNVAEIESSSF